MTNLAIIFTINTIDMYIRYSLYIIIVVWFTFCLILTIVECYCRIMIVKIPFFSITDTSDRSSSGSQGVNPAMECWEIDK